MSLEAPTQGEVKSLLSLLPPKFTLGDAIEASKSIWVDNIQAKQNLSIIALLNKMRAKGWVKRTAKRIEKKDLPKPRIIENEGEICFLYIYSKV